MSVFIWSGRRFIKSDKIPPSRNSADARLVRQIGPNHDTHREPVVCRGYWCQGVVVRRQEGDDGRRVRAVIRLPTLLTCHSGSKNNVEPKAGPERLGKLVVQ